MTRVWKIIVWVVLGLYIPIMLSFVSFNQRNIVCNSVKVTIKDSTNLKFVTESDMNGLIQSHFKMIHGSKVDDINIEEVENLIRKYPAVEDCQVYPSVDGTLCVVVDQRNPLLRVFDRGASYLLDEEGVRIPLKGSYHKSLLVVSGFLDRVEKKDLLELTRFVTGDSFWNAQIEQVYIEPDGEFILVPRVGEQKIIFGGVYDMKIKFRNLKALYEKGFHPLEWNSYKTINLKYKGQVICSKI